MELAKMSWAASAAGILIVMAAGSARAASIPLTNGNFETTGQTNDTAFSFPTPGWSDSSGGAGAVGEFVETDYGLNGNPPGSSADPDGGTQAAYIAGSGGTWMAQQIGTLNTSAVYTIDFSLSTDGTSSLGTVELVDGSPTGSVLASATNLTGIPNVWTFSSKVLTPFGGANGDPLFLEFIHSGGSQLFVDGVTASYSVPEPASAGLLGLGVFGLLARRRRD